MRQSGKCNKGNRCSDRSSRNSTNRSNNSDGRHLGIPPLVFIITGYVRSKSLYDSDSLDILFAMSALLLFIGLALPVFIAIKVQLVADLIKCRQLAAFQ